MRFLFRTTSWCCFLLLATAAARGATVVYTENFTNTAQSAGTAQAFGSAGWYAHYGATAVNHTNLLADPTSSSRAAIWHTTAMGGTPGYGFGSLGAPALYWTTEPGLIALGLVETVSFYANNTSSSSSFRVAIRLDNGTSDDTSDDFWVVSSQAFNSSTEGSSGNWIANGKLETLVFSSAASSWRNLTFVEDSSLVLGAERSVDLPTGNITAFGLWASGGTVRFDDFSIALVPEPGRGMLALGALVGVVFRRRRI
jgi:hypothetical protein